jgi:hypothetical protein
MHTVVPHLAALLFAILIINGKEKKKEKAD